jgi:hypothetical protein
MAACARGIYTSFIFSPIKAQQSGFDWERKNKVIGQCGGAVALPHDLMALF